MKRVMSFTVAAAAFIGLANSGFSGDRLPSKYVGQRAILIEEVVNQQPDFMVRVDVDHKNRTYKVGELVNVTVRSSRNGFLYLLYLQANGETVVLFPNKHHDKNRITKNKNVSVPAAGARFQMRVGNPTGKELLKAIVTTKALTADDLKNAKFHDATPVKSSRVRAIFVEEVQQNNSQSQSNSENNTQQQNGEPTKKSTWAEHHIEITTFDPDKTPETDPVQNEAKQRRVAVCIGISQFADDRIRDLTICHQDAESFAKMLKTSCGFDEVILLTNKRATRVAIEKAIRGTLAEKTGPNDEIVIYWSGHGARIADESGDETTDGKDEVLVPHDANMSGIESIKKSVITDDTFGRWIQDLDGRRCLIVLDTCHSGGQSNREKGLFRLPSDAKALVDVSPGTRFDFFDHERSRVKDIGQHGVAVLASSRASELSFERKQGDLSVMTSCIIEYVENTDGDIPLRRLFKHLEKAVPEYVQKNESSSTQTPLLVSDIYPDFVVKPQNRLIE